MADTVSFLKFLNVSQQLETMGNKGHCRVKFHCFPPLRGGGRKQCKLLARKPSAPKAVKDSDEAGKNRKNGAKFPRVETGEKAAGLRHISCFLPSREGCGLAGKQATARPRYRVAIRPQGAD